MLIRYPCSFCVIAQRDLRQEYSSSNASTGYVLSAKCTEMLIPVSRSPHCCCSALAGKGRGTQEVPFLWAKEVLYPRYHVSIWLLFFIFRSINWNKMLSWKESLFFQVLLWECKVPEGTGEALQHCFSLISQRAESSFFLVRSTGMDTTPSVPASVLPSWLDFQQIAEHSSKIYRSSVILENSGCARSHRDGSIA